MNVFSLYSLCNPAEFFFLSADSLEAILEGGTHFTRDVGIPYISSSVDFRKSIFKADFFSSVTLQILFPVGRFHHEATNIGREDQ